MTALPPVNVPAIEAVEEPAGGGVTSVSGTDPIASSGGATPVISIAAASTAQDGAVELATVAETLAGASDVLAVTPAGAAGSYVPLLQPVRTPVFAANDYTLVLADAGALLQASNAAVAGTITVPPNASVAFDIGTHIDFVQTGAGQLTFTAGGGVTINATPGLKNRAQWSGATLVKVATDTWDLFGDLSA